jgi:hypothetical protein
MSMVIPLVRNNFASSGGIFSFPVNAIYSRKSNA